MMKKTLFILTAVSVAVLSGCNIMPSSGPTQSAVMNLDESKLPTVKVVELTAAETQSLYQASLDKTLKNFTALSEPSDFANLAQVGDVLEISIWEAPPAVLFGTSFNSEGQSSAGAVQLPPQTVNQNGTISVPFVGNLRVAGSTPEQIQNRIVGSLRGKANQPQALVRIVNNQSSDVTVIRQGNSIRMPLTAGGERVLDAVAAVGGSMADIQDVTVQLTRNNQVRTVPFETLIAEPVQNISLRSGDVVTLLNTPYSFTGLGAVGTNQQVKFSTKGLSLGEAIGKMGGLLDRRSDPRGVFVFRYLPLEQLSENEQQEWLARGYQRGQDVPTVYRVNLLEPQAMFMLQRFPMQDKDIVYVSNAPMAEFNKFIAMIFSAANPALSIHNATN